MPYTFELTHRPRRDGSEVENPHMWFHTIFEYSYDAWIAAFAEHVPHPQNALRLAVINANAEFRREMFVGESIWDVTLEKFGTSSATVVMHIQQGGELAVVATIVLVQVDPGIRGPLPWSQTQRDQLETWRAA